jgi:hypothetical protein
MARVKHEGTVVFSKCGCCGHHEVCVMNENGDFIPLKKGEFVTIHKYDPEQIGAHMKKVHKAAKK